MNTKKRWIITVIAALALAAIVVIGVILNHSADRVLKATDGSVETSSSSEETEEQVPEEQPAEETIELSLSAPEEGALEPAPEEVSGQEKAALETAAESEAPEVITEAAAEGEAPELITETAAEGKVPEETEVSAEAGGEEHVFVTTLDNDNETAEAPEEAAEEEHVIVTTKDNEASEEETPDAEEEEEEESGETELRADAGNGTQVSVRKLHGSFPAGAYVKALIIPNDSAQSAVEEALDEYTELVDLIAYDITIYDKDGNEIIPDKDVEVTILGANLAEGQDVSVYHIEENGVAEKVTDVQNPAQISFGAQTN